MADQLQFRGGSTAENNAFTGVAREVTVDTTKDTLRVHDGVNKGGHELAKADLSNFTGTFHTDLRTTHSIQAGVGSTSTSSIRVRATNADGYADFGTHGNRGMLWVNNLERYYAHGDGGHVWKNTHNTLQMTITEEGRIGVGSGTAASMLDVRYNHSTLPCAGFYNLNASFSQPLQILRTETAAQAAFSFLTAYHSGSVRGFNLRGDGNAFAEGSWTGGGADYAEYFEWADGNPDNEDRRGWSVSLTEGNKIKRAENGESVIGVISANPSVVGDAAWNAWHEKYECDAFGSYVMEDYQVVAWTETKTIAATEDEAERTEEIKHSYATDEVPDGLSIPEDATYTTQQRRKLNPDFDETADYLSREDRPEWSCVGLMGKLRVRKGEETDPRWIKMRDISDHVEEWLVR